MPTKRNYLVKVLDAKIVDVKRALEAKGIKLESIYEMYKETKEPEKVATSPALGQQPSGQATAHTGSGTSGPAATGQTGPSAGKPPADAKPAAPKEESSTPGRDRA